MMEVDLIKMRIGWLIEEKYVTFELGSTFGKEELFVYCVIYGSGDRVELVKVESN